MAKRSSRSASSKRLEALIRAQKMSELLKIGGMQSQALLDSAGESRPSDESHVGELLDSERYTRAELASESGKRRRKGAGKQSRSRSALSAKSSSKKKRRK